MERGYFLGLRLVGKDGEFVDSLYCIVIGQTSGEMPVYLTHDDGGFLVGVANRPQGLALIRFDSGGGELGMAYGHTIFAASELRGGNAPFIDGTSLGAASPFKVGDSESQGKQGHIELGKFGALEYRLSYRRMGMFEARDLGPKHAKARPVA
jgi:hypothetical protein